MEVPLAVYSPSTCWFNTCHPGVGHGTSTGRDSPRRLSHLTDRRRGFMISIRYLIAGTRIITIIRTRMVHLPSTITEADGAPLERRIKGSVSVDRCGKRLITPGTTVTEEVVTELAYLGITSTDNVEYSGLMIDGQQIVCMQVGFRAPLWR